MRTMISIGEASEALGVTPQTLRRWHESGRVLERLHTAAEAADA